MVSQHFNENLGSEEANEHLFILSGESESRLEAARENLANDLRGSSDADLADVACSLTKRPALPYRCMFLCRDVQDALDELQGSNPNRAQISVVTTSSPLLVFMFSGLGDHYVSMGFGLYRQEPIFRQVVDRCCDILKRHLGLDLRNILFPHLQKRTGPADSSAGVDLRKMLFGEEQKDEHTTKLNQTCLTHPAIFVIEYALARLWMSWGIAPRAMVGYSIGEYVAACLAGVFSLEDALSLVAKRATLIDSLPPGGMLAVQLPESDLKDLLTGTLSLAAVNGPSLCVVSGNEDAVSELEQRLSQNKVMCRRLQASHAFHSDKMRPIAVDIEKEALKIKLTPPRLPYISNLTGTWITEEQATDPRYYAQHAYSPVRFSEAVQTLLDDSGNALLEVGPGQTLRSLVMLHPSHTGNREHMVLSSLRYAFDRTTDQAFILKTLGSLWLAGVDVDWEKVQSMRPPEEVRLALTFTNPVEQRLAEAWQELLGAFPPSPEGDFFAAGGDSTSAELLRGWLQEVYQVNLPPSFVHDHATVARQALALEELVLGEIEQLSEEEAEQLALQEKEK